MKNYNKINLKKSTAFVLLSVTLATTFQTQVFAETNTIAIVSSDVNTTSDILVNVIVELKELPVSVQVTNLGKTEKQALEAIEAEHVKFEKIFNDIVNNKNDKNVNLKNSKISLEYEYTLNGYALTIPGNKIESLVKSGLVKKVWLDVNSNISATATTSSKSKNLDSLSLINVDKLHNEGVLGLNNGKAIKVGVIDTGIDYNHPSLTSAYKGARTENLKYNDVLGWDFVDGDSDPMETTYGDWIEAYEKNKKGEYIGGATYYTTHGTHVSGIVTGTAPKVELYGYRVIGPYSTTNALSWTLGAVEKSVVDDMDVVNMSLTGKSNAAKYVLSNAVNNAVLSGVTVVAAAGNSGEYGNMSMPSPGTSPLAITVGASTFDGEVKVADLEFRLNNGYVDVYSSPMVASDGSDVSSIYEIVNGGIVYVGYANESDIKDIDLKDKIVVVDRGSDKSDVKIKRVKEAGARVAILIGGDESIKDIYFGDADEYCPTFSVSDAEGEMILENFSNGGKGVVSFTNEYSYHYNGDEFALLSSKGPSVDSYDIKPDIVAPGVSVNSTVAGKPVFDKSGKFTGKYDYTNAYVRMTGTSMAAPHITGIAALVLSQHPDYTPQDVKSAITNTAVPLADKTLSVYEVGAGRVDAYAAVNTPVLIKSLDNLQTYENGIATKNDYIKAERGSINFGSSTSKNEVKVSKDMSIENNTKSSKTFTTRVEYTDPRQETKTLRKISSSKDNKVVLNVPSTITVNGNSTQKFNVNLTVPNTAEKGIYEGYVYFKDKATGTEYRVPFAFGKN